MKGRTIVIILALALALGSAAGLTAGVLARTGPDDREGEPNPSTESREQIELEKMKGQARSVAEKYTAAITASEEWTAAQYTCRKRDGSMLWIVAVGRKITVLDVKIGGPFAGGTATAKVTIQVDGKSPSLLHLIHKDGTWCVWP